MVMRLVDPENRFVELFVDELHWLKLTEVATEKGVVVDKLMGAIIEGVLVKLGKIERGEVGDSPIKLEVTLEPVREDKQFFDALVTERSTADRHKNLAKSVSDLDLEDMDWGDV